MMLEKICDVSQKLALELGTQGLVNIQYLIYHNELYVIEVNPRAVSYTHLDVYKRQIYRSLRSDPGSFRVHAGCEGKGLQKRKVQLQRQRRPVRSMRRRRDPEDRDAFPAGCICPVRGLPGEAVQPGNAGSEIQREKHL